MVIGSASVFDSATVVDGCNGVTGVTVATVMLLFRVTTVRLTDILMLMVTVKVKATVIMMVTVTMKVRAKKFPVIVLIIFLRSLFLGPYLVPPVQKTLQAVQVSSRVEVDILLQGATVGG